MVEEYRQRIVIPGAGEVTQTALSDYPSITYRQFRTLEFSLRKHPSGLLVEDVPVRSLLTTSRALEGVETQRVEGHIKDGKCITPIQAVIGHFPNIRQGFSLVVIDGDQGAVYAAVHNVGKVPVLLRPQVFRPSETVEIRPIGALARQHKDFLRKKPDTTDVCVVGIHELKGNEGDYAIKMNNGQRSFRVQLLGIDGDRVSFINQEGEVREARMSADAIEQWLRINKGR